MSSLLPQRGDFALQQFLRHYKWENIAVLTDLILEIHTLSRCCCCRAESSVDYTLTTPGFRNFKSFLSDLPALGGGLDDEGSDVGDVVVREAAAEGGHGTLAVGDLGHDGLLVEATGEELQRFCGQLHVHVQETRKGPRVLLRVDRGMDLDEIPTIEPS